MYNYFLTLFKNFTRLKENFLKVADQFLYISWSANIPVRKIWMESINTYRSLSLKYRYLSILHCIDNSHHNHTQINHCATDSKTYQSHVSLVVWFGRGGISESSAQQLGKSVQLLSSRILSSKIPQSTNWVQII